MRDKFLITIYFIIFSSSLAAENIQIESKNITLDKNKQIVVYCSIGVRSEIIAKKIRALGYTNVYNLYGGLFEWVNKGGELFLANKRTQKVHAYSKKWGAYLTEGIKVYE